MDQRSIENSGTTSPVFVTIVDISLGFFQTIHLLHKGLTMKEIEVF